MSKKIIIVGIIFLMSFGIILTGCGKVNGTFYTLEELYESGEISHDDLKNIAGLRVGSVMWVEKETPFHTKDKEVIEFDIKEPESPLDEKTAKMIESDFKAAREGEFSEFSMTYYGTYNGYVVVGIAYDIKNAGFALYIREQVVGKVYIGNYTANSNIYAWRMNEQ